MSTRNVIKSNPQVKLFLDPSLLNNGFEIEALLNEMRIEMNAIAVSAGTVLLLQVLEAEVALLVGDRYSRDGDFYTWKSVVSRELVAATAAQLDALCARSLADFDLAVLMIDGIDLAGTMFIAALGIDHAGNKRILGFLDGATENSTVCIRMLEDLCERGLRLDHPFLAVLDGSKALAMAVREVGGQHVVIQRCQVHKIRNVLSHLPNTYHVHFDRKIRVAYGMTAYSEAKKALEAIVRELGNISMSDARSLEEGLEETLTVHRLCLPESLRKSFSSTNIIESAYSRSRHVMRNVKRWKSTTHKSRWIATALLHTEKSFRRIKGHLDMPVLKAALAANQFHKSEAKVAA